MATAIRKIIFATTLVVAHAMGLSAVLCCQESRDTGTQAYDPYRRSVVAPLVFIDGSIYYSRPPGLFVFDPSTLELRWNRPLVRFNFFAEQCASDGVTFVREDDDIHAFRTADGVELWKTRSGDDRVSGCALGGSDVYTVCHGDVCAFDRKTGERRLLAFHVSQASWVRAFGGSVYVLADQQMIAIDPETRSLRWSVAVSNGYEAGLLEDSGIYLFGSIGVMALEQHTGRTKWRMERAVLPQSEPFTYQDVLVIATDKSVYALDQGSGQERWHYPGPCWLDASPMIAHDILYVACGHNSITAISLKTKEVVWRSEFGVWNDSRIALGQGILFVASARFLFALDADGGSIRNVFRAGAWIRTSALVVGDMVYVGIDQGGTLASTLPENAVLGFPIACTNLAIKGCPPSVKYDPITRNDPWFGKEPVTQHRK